MADKGGRKRGGAEPSEMGPKKARIEDSTNNEEREKAELMRVNATNAQTMRSLTAQLQKSQEEKREAERTIRQVTRERDELRVLLRIPPVMPVTFEASLEQQTVPPVEDDNADDQSLPQQSEESDGEAPN